MQNEENNKSPEESQTAGRSTDGSSGSSTGDSTGAVEPIEPLNVPEISEEKPVNQWTEKGWRYEEMREMITKKGREKIIRYCRYVRTPDYHEKRQVEQAKAYFEKNFPTRSPYAVYQKALMVARGRYKRVILI